jgi:hypothetical protein
MPQRAFFWAHSQRHLLMLDSSRRWNRQEGDEMKIHAYAVVVLVIFILVISGCASPTATTTSASSPGTAPIIQTVTTDFSVLRGRWDGSVNLRGVSWPDGPDRTLIIETIDSQSGTFAGQHGVPHKKLFPIKGVVKIENNQPGVRFTTAGKAEVSVGLVTPNELRGIYDSDGERYPVQYKKAN